MKFSALFVIALAFCAISAADFSLSPYIYPTEANATINYTTFASSAANNSTAKIVMINNEEIFLLVNEKPVTDKAQITSILSDYYQANFYPSQDEMGQLSGYALSFNKSRNYVGRYGPAEQVCWTQGTFLSYKPCDTLTTCMQTASLVCYITGSEGCIVDLLAQYILDYKKSVDGLNKGYASFNSAYYSFSPSTITASLNSMDSAFDAMKTAGQSQAANKLRFPETTTCRDCLGVCPEPHLDFGAITSGKALIARLRAKTAPYASLQQTVERISISTEQRLAFKAGEEKAIVFGPKYNAAIAKFGGLKAQAVEAKLLVSDTNFVSAADAFLNKGDELEQKFNTRDFGTFDYSLSSYESAGRNLASMINNSTSAYKSAAELQDQAGDKVLQAQWRVNRLSPASVTSYNSLADRLNKLDAQLKPPMTAAQYGAISGNYVKLKSDADAYIAASGNPQDSIFSAGNALGRTSVDGAMSVVSAMAPVSFKTRQSLAKYVPPLVLAAIDLSILAAGMLAFIGAFYYFRGFFRSKIAISGWALTMLGFVFVLLVGSVGFYSIVMSTEKFTSFTDFMGTVQGADRVAVIVEEGGSPSIAGMHACADQIEAQMKTMGKRTVKYYVNGASCTSMTQKFSGNLTNSTAISYDTKTGLSQASCLDNLPDIPIFDLKYSQNSEPPAFTTVVTKQAIIKGSDAYYSKRMCDIANVLG